jgi:hypothetical protein
MTAGEKHRRGKMALRVLHAIWNPRGIGVLIQRTAPTRSMVMKVRVSRPLSDRSGAAEKNRENI